MPKFLTVEKAKEEIEFLRRLIELVEMYDPDTIEKKIVFEYAHFGSCRKVFELLSKIGYVDDYEYVKDVIKSEPMDELHKEVRRHYMQKTKSLRSRY